MQQVTTNSAPRRSDRELAIRREFAERVRRSSVNAVARELHLPRTLVASLAGEASVRDGSLALAAERLASGGSPTP